MPAMPAMPAPGLRPACAGLRPACARWNPLTFDAAAILPPVRSQTKGQRNACQSPAVVIPEFDPSPTTGAIGTPLD